MAELSRGSTRRFGARSADVAVAWFDLLRDYDIGTLVDIERIERAQKRLA
jgi:hypothetical protein